MKILFVSVEVAPFAKVGGLADVAGSLPKALRALGHDVRILMPAYGMILDDPEWPKRPVLPEFKVPMNSEWQKSAFMYETTNGEVPVYLVGNHEWFHDAVDSKSIYRPGKEQYLFFSRAIFAACEQIGWIPDVLHCHDWHTGFAPVLLREQSGPQWRGTASAFTIHNLAYQGEFDEDVLDAVGLPHRLYNMEQLETFGRVNFLKAGCVYSDVVNTVSPTYAQEIQTPEFGCHLEGLMRHLAQHGRLLGILNGIDTEEFDPSADENLAQNFTAEAPEGKRVCKAGLARELGFKDPMAPTMGVVARLSEQKGMDLLAEILPRLAAAGANVVVQGLGDPAISSLFHEAEEKYRGNFRFMERFDADLAQRIYAGCDIFLMPSAFEPCGLGQMIAMRYGTIPIVRATGGLADTVFEGLNGFSFANKSAIELFAACRRAIEAFKKPAVWGQLMRNAMSHDYGWGRSAREYVGMYEHALRDRRGMNASAAG